MKHKFFNSIAFRLTLWFTGIFSVCAGIAFLLFYLLSVQTLQDQTDRELMDNAAKFSTVIRRAGLVGARELAVIEAQAAGEKQIFFRLLYPSGQVFASSHMSYWQNVHISKNALQQMMLNKVNVFETIKIPNTNQRARILYYPIAANAVLQTGIALENMDRFLSQFKNAFLGIIAFILIFSAVSGWLLIQKALGGVKAISNIAQNISGSNLEGRVKTSAKSDELDDLADTFNLMLDRIEELVQSIKEMSDNIAHDLKSPITKIRGFAEIALIHEDNLENYRQMAATTIEESDRLLDMINTMLLISKAEAGEGDFNFQPTNLSFMVEEACELFLPLAEDKNISIETFIESDITIWADLKMLQRAFSNLLDNAIKYTHQGGQIQISMTKISDSVVIKVKDNGIGIDPIHFDKIFERFYRAESSRSTSGTGLGLSLAKTIVLKHQGQIFVDSEPGGGAEFEIRLPIDNFQII